MSPIPRWARAAIAAALLWMVSSGLFPVLALLGIYDGHAGPALLGGSISAETWLLPTPWPFVVVGASTLMFSALVGFGVEWVARAQPSSRRQLFFAVWLIVVAAAAATGAIQDLGSRINGMMTPAFLVEVLASAASSAMYAGFVFGWIPAWLVIAWPASVSSTSTGRKRSIIVGLAMVVAIILLIGSVSAATVFQRTANESSRDEEPAFTPSPAPTNPPPIVAPTSVVADVDWCGSEDVVFADAGAEAASGARGASIRVTNVGPDMCVLSSYPDLAFVDNKGNAVDAAVEPGSGWTIDDVGPVRLELQPGDSAVTYAGWRSTDGRTTLSTLFMAPYAGAPRTAVHLAHPWDVTDATTVKLTAWQLSGPVDPFAD